VNLDAKISFCAERRRGETAEIPLDENTIYSWLTVLVSFHLLSRQIRAEAAISSMHGLALLSNIGEGS
jgi:hypothetical protein